MQSTFRTEQSERKAQTVPQSAQIPIQQSPQQQVYQDEFQFNGSNQAFMRQQLTMGNCLSAQVAGYSAVNPCNPCQASPLQLSVMVVTKEEIEAPWRQECEYLQSVITELESRRVESKVVEKVIEKERIVMDTESIRKLELQISQLKSTNAGLNTLQNQLYDKDMELQSMRSKLRDFEDNQNQLQSGYSDWEDKYTTLDEEFRNYQKDTFGQISKLENQLRDSQDLSKQLKYQIAQLEADNRRKDQELELRAQSISTLQLNLSKNNKVVDMDQINSLKEQLAQLRTLLNQRTSECDQLRIRASQLESDNQQGANKYRIQISDLQSTISQLQQENDRFRGMLQSKDQEIEEWSIRYSQLESQGSTVIQEKVTYLSQEVDVWKQKFIKLNHEYNQCQEELIMTQAELESLQKQKREVVVERTTRVVGNTTTTNGGTTTSQRTGGYQRTQLQ